MRIHKTITMAQRTCFRATSLVLALLIAGLLHAQTRDFGLGFVLGEPTGLSLKGKLNDANTIQGSLAWNFRHGGAFQVSVDYLHHNYNAFSVSKGRLPFYYGLGGRMRFWDGDLYWRDGRWRDRNGSADLALRVPVGLAYEFASDPLDIFLEVVPTVGLLPATYVDVNAGLGMRYWF